MKFFLSFAGVLVAILLLVRFLPSAPINPVLPVGPQKEVNGHNSEVPHGADSDDETPVEPQRETVPSTKVPVAPGQTYGATASPRATRPTGPLSARYV